jgi:hypothetical protein
MYMSSQYNGPLADYLWRADLLAYSDAECNRQYEGSGPSEKNICAGGGGTGICAVSLFKFEISII